MIRRAIVALSMLVASPAIAREQVVEATGVAPLSGDPAQARWRAIGDALRQAIASGGLDMRAATPIDRNVIRSAVMWATAQSSEERRVGKEGGGKWRARWAPVT